MKIALGQINTIPNDFEGNCRQIKEGIKAAGQANSDLIVFPELSIPGYLCKDLLYRKNFVDKNLKALTDICAHTTTYPDLTVVVGYVGKNHKGSGKPFTNMAAVIRNGLVLVHYQKQLLPFYDVFDEGRYFEPGTNPAFVEIKGKKFLITICEDIWNDKGQDDYNYADNPLATLDRVDIEGVINLSSSPYAFDKPQSRMKMLARISNRPLPLWPEKGGCLLIYVNQIGGQDELSFDGRSCILDQGSLIYQHPSTKDSSPKIPIVEFTPGCWKSNGWLKTEAAKIRVTTGSHEKEFVHSIQVNEPFNAAIAKPAKELYNAVLIGLRDYIAKTGFKEVVLGSSGGIDSAVTAALACDAVGPNNVHCIMMPSIFSSEGSVNHAKQLHKNLGCNEYTIPIEHQHLIKSINSYFPDQLSNCSYNSVANENIQARLRGITVMHTSNAFGYLPLTTGNKTELALGYCTLYGDQAGGYNPLGDLYKDQVYALARHINESKEIILNKTSGEIIPWDIINKAPSAELSKDQTDEEGLGASYGFLNAVVRGFVEHHINDFSTFKSWWTKDKYPFASEQDERDINHLLAKGKIAKDLYYELIRRIDYMEFKRRQSAPTVKVSNVAFGTGRRLPIVQKVYYETI